MLPEPSSLLIVSNSGRAIAESAARGGYRVAVLDAFCDEDTRALASCSTVPTNGYGLDPHRLRAQAERLPLPVGSCGLLYGSGLEGAPSVLSWLARSFPLLGNRSQVLDLLRDPRRFFALLDGLGISYPEIRFDPPAPGDERGWLIKETGGSGGLGVRPWRHAEARPQGLHYFQRFVEGPVMSVLFIADGRDLRVVGYNRLLSTAVSGDLCFVYGGAISQAPLSASRKRRVVRYCGDLVRALGLRGMNNLDFVLEGDGVCVLELNPRPSASASLYDGDCAGGWVKRHVQACLGKLAPWPAPNGQSVSGHRVVYAPGLLHIRSGMRWPAWAKDRPGAGARIGRGMPVCSVLASARSAAEVERLLVEREHSVLRLLARKPGSGA